MRVYREFLGELDLSNSKVVGEKVYLNDGVWFILPKPTKSLLSVGRFGHIYFSVSCKIEVHKPRLFSSKTEEDEFILGVFYTEEEANKYIDKWG